MVVKPFCALEHGMKEICIIRRKVAMLAMKAYGNHFVIVAVEGSIENDRYPDCV